MVDVNCGLCKCFDKKSATHADKSAINTSGGAIKANYQKPIITKFEKHKTYSLFADSICHAHLADVQLIKEYIEQI